MKNIRTCIACRQKFNKAETSLIKITKNNSGIFINEKVDGRSCYVCNENSCLEKVIKNKLLSKAFKYNIDNSVYEKLINFKGI